MRRSPTALISVLALTAGLGVALAACGENSPSTPAETSPAVSAPAAGVPGQAAPQAAATPEQAAAPAADATAAMVERLTGKAASAAELAAAKGAA